MKIYEDNDNDIIYIYHSEVMTNVNSCFKKHVKCHRSKDLAPTERSYHKEYSNGISKL